MAKGSKRRLGTIKTVNQVLGRANPYPSLPPGGKPGDVLVKIDNPDGEADWQEADAPPFEHDPVPLGDMKSAWAAVGNDGEDKNTPGWYSAGAYAFHRSEWGNSSSSRGGWIGWIDSDTDAARWLINNYQTLVGAYLVMYFEPSPGKNRYSSPERALITEAPILTHNVGPEKALQIEFPRGSLKDEGHTMKWTQPTDGAYGSHTWDPPGNHESHYFSTYWSNYNEHGTQRWEIHRQTDYMTRAQSDNWRYGLLIGGHEMLNPPGSSASFSWPSTYYNHTLMWWNCKVGGSNGTYGSFALSVNAYGTGTTLYCPPNSLFDFHWTNSNSRTEFRAGSIKINGSSVSRAADLLAVAKESKDAEDFRARLIAFLEEIVERDTREAKAAAALEENPPEPELEPEQEPEKAPKPRRTRRKKADD